MTSLKIMSIVGLVITAFAFVCLLVFSDQDNYNAGIGWGLIECLYSVSFMIVALVVASKAKKE